MGIIGIALLSLKVFFEPVPITPAAEGTLIIKVENIRTPKGVIWVGLYDNEKHFMAKEHAVVKGFEVTQTGAQTLQISGLPFGTYAMALFHDINQDGNLDQNVLGIPTEPFAFSRKPVSKYRKPYFKEVTFEFQKDPQVLNTVLEKWWE